MKSSYVWLLVYCLLFSFNAFGQTEGDAIRYSSNTFGTTARSLSMGGAFGALGADFSSLAINPAGIAVYRKSEASISPTFNIRNISSEYINNTTDDSRFYFNLGSAGIVFSGYKPQRKGWKGWNFGFGYNRDECYKRNVSWQGFNTKNSLYDAMAEDVTGIPYSEFDALGYAFDAGLAWNVYLLNPAPTGPTDYESAIPNGGVLQVKTEDVVGRKGSFILGLGNNYNEKLQIGLSMEFTGFSYWEDLVYEEFDIYDSIISPYQQMDFKSSYYSQYKYTRGNGFLAKFGAIYRATEFLRVGLSVHTPGWYNVTYEDEYNMAAQFGNTSDSLMTQLPLASAFAYNLTTPFRLVGSVAYIHGKSFILSLDYEVVDYPMTKMKAPDYNFYVENQNLKIITKWTSNIRIGGEYKKDVFAFRAGMAFYGSPYESLVTNDEYNFSSTSFTLGAGIREKKYFADIGYALTKTKAAYQPYTMNEEVPEVKQIINTNRIMLTFGLRF